MATNATANIIVSAETTLIPKAVQKAMALAQANVNRNPLKIVVDTKGLGNLNALNKLPLGKMSKDADHFSQSMAAATSRVIAFTTAVGAMFAVQRAFTDLIKTGINVEKQFKEIDVLLSSTTEQFKQFERGVFSAASTTATSFDEAAKAAQEFARQGLSLEKTLARTNDALTLSKLAGIDVEKSVESLTAAFNTFSSELSNTADIVDKLARVDAKFAVSSNDLVLALARVGNTAQEAGASFEDTLGAITALQQRTARGGANIGNSLKSIFTRVQRSETLDAIESLGVATRNLEGGLRPALSVLDELADKFKTLGTAQKKQLSEQIAGTYQINSFLALMADLGSSTSILSQASKEAQNAAGDAVSRLAELTTTTDALLKQSTVNITELSAAIYDISFDGVIKNLLKIFTANGGIIKQITDSISNIDSDAETIGSRIAETILKGIANVIGGPGGVLIITLIGKLLFKVAADLKGIAGSLLGFNSSLKNQLALQESIGYVVNNTNAYYQRRLALATTLAEKELVILDILKSQQLASSRVSPDIAGLSRRGWKVDSRTGMPRMAGGFIPTMQSEKRSIKSSPAYSGNRNAQPTVIPNFSVNGRRQNVVANSAEKIVPTNRIIPNYAGPDKQSILNPMQQKMFGFGKGFVPNFAKDILLSSGAIISPNKKYVFRPSQGQFTDDYRSIDNTERLVSRRNGYETLTETDLLEYSKKRGVGPIKIVDPTRDLSNNFLKLNPQLKNKLYISQASRFELDKFQETQLAKGFGKSTDSIGSFKTVEDRVSSFNSLRKQLGDKFYIKDKKGAGGTGVLSSDALGDYMFYSQKEAQQLKQLPGGKEAWSLFNKFKRNPSRFFAQKAIENTGEYRVPIVGTQSGSFPLGIFGRGKLNDAGSTFEFADSAGKIGSVASSKNVSNLRAVLQQAQSSINSLPKYIRNRFVGGLDVTSGGVFELNPSNKIGYSGALDNPAVRARTASVLDSITAKDVGRATKIGLDILNYKGSDQSRQSRFNQFNKALLNLKKVDEVAYTQIAANLGRSGFGIKAGGKMLGGLNSINKYFSRRGFSGGYIPNFANPLMSAISRESSAGIPLNKIRVSQDSRLKSAFNPSGMAVSNTLDEPFGIGQGINRAISEGRNPKTYGVPNFASPSDIRNSLNSKIISGENLSRREMNRAQLDFRNDLLIQKGISSDQYRNAVKKQNTDPIAKALVESVAKSVGKYKNELANKIGQNLFNNMTPELDRAVRGSGIGGFTGIGKRGRQFLSSKGLNYNTLGSAERGQYDSIIQNARGTRLQKLQTAGFGASFVLPFLASALESVGGDNKATRFGSEALKGAGTGALIGSFIGPTGTAIGAGLGAAGGLAISAASEADRKQQKSVENLQKKTDKISEQFDRAAEFTGSFSNLQDLISSGASPSIINKSQKDLFQLIKSIDNKSILGNINKLQSGDISIDQFVEKNAEAQRKAQQKLNIQSIKEIRRSASVNSGVFNNIFDDASIKGFGGEDKVKGLGAVIGESFGNYLTDNVIKQIQPNGRGVLNQLEFASATKDAEAYNVISEVNRNIDKEAKKILEESIAIRIKELKEQEKLNESARKTSEAIGSLNKQLNKTINLSNSIESVNNLRRDIRNTNSINARTSNLELNKPFLSPYQISDIETGIGRSALSNDLGAGISDITGSGRGLLAEILNKNSNSLSPALKSQFLNTATDTNSNNFLNNLDELIKVLESGKNNQGIVEELNTIKSNTALELTKLNLNNQDQVDKLEKQNTLTKNLSDQNKLISRFGGREGFLSGQRFNRNSISRGISGIVGGRNDNTPQAIRNRINSLGKDKAKISARDLNITRGRDALSYYQEVSNITGTPIEDLIKSAPKDVRNSITLANEEDQLNQIRDIGRLALEQSGIKKFLNPEQIARGEKILQNINSKTGLADFKNYISGFKGSSSGFSNARQTALDTISPFASLATTAKQSANSQLGIGAKFNSFSYPFEILDNYGRKGLINNAQNISTNEGQLSGLKLDLSNKQAAAEKSIENTKLINELQRINSELAEQENLQSRLNFNSSGITSSGGQRVPINQQRKFNPSIINDADQYRRSLIESYSLRGQKQAIETKLNEQAPETKAELLNNAAESIQENTQTISETMATINETLAALNASIIELKNGNNGDGQVNNTANISVQANGSMEDFIAKITSQFQNMNAKIVQMEKQGTDKGVFKLIPNSRVA